VFFPFLPPFSFLAIAGYKEACRVLLLHAACRAPSCTLRRVLSRPGPRSVDTDVHVACVSNAEAREVQAAACSNTTSLVFCRRRRRRTERLWRRIGSSPGRPGSSAFSFRFISSHVCFHPSSPNIAHHPRTVTAVVQVLPELEHTRMPVLAPAPAATQRRQRERQAAGRGHFSGLGGRGG
jgi:hypothetical protein